MNVLHVTPYFAPAWACGPVPRAVAELARAQVAAGHQVVVLTTDATAPHERLPSGDQRVEGVRVFRARNISGVARMWLNVSTPVGMRARARALFQSEQFDIVHLHELRTVENLLVVAEASPAVPLVLSPHGTLNRRTGRSWARRAWDASVGDRLLARVGQLIACSDTEAEEIAALYGERGIALRPDAIAVVRSGADVSAIYSHVLSSNFVSV